MFPFAMAAAGGWYGEAAGAAGGGRGACMAGVFVKQGINVANR